MSAPHQKDLLLQDAPDHGFGGLGIKSAKIQLKSWPQVILIGLWGI